MKHYISIATATVLAFALPACGGGDSADTGSAATPGAAPAAAPAASGGGELTTPSWYSYDAAANKVTMTITAGTTNVNNWWNFNGAVKGSMDVVVPVGAAVELTFVNADQGGMAHSLGISATPGTQLPAMFTSAEAAFAGAMTDSPLDQLKATQVGDSATLNFTADKAGDYTMVCYVPGHAITGMWIKFTVSATGDAGVRGAM